MFVNPSSVMQMQNVWNLNRLNVAEHKVRLSFPELSLTKQELPYISDLMQTLIVKDVLPILCSDLKKYYLDKISN